MKVVLLAPQSTRPAGRPILKPIPLDPPIGLLYLATFAQDLAEFSVIDCNLDRLSPEEAGAAILALKPDLVGITLNFVPLLKFARKVAQYLKKREPSLFIVFGGNFATFYSDQLIKKTWVDAVILKEGERSFRSLLENLSATGGLVSVPGSLVKTSSGIKKQAFTQYVANLDELPFPDYDFLPRHEQYMKSIVTSRGCPYTCIYCSTKAMWSRWRPRSAANILAEIDVLRTKFAATRINFFDDHFLVSRKRTVEFLEGLAARNYPIEWGFSARLETVDDEILERLGAAKCRNIFFGIESGSPKVLNHLERQSNIEEIEHKIDKCIKVGIIPHAAFMIGLPWETKDDVEATLALLARINTPSVLLSVFTPFMGTPVYENPAQYGITLHKHSIEEEEQIDNGAVFHSTPFLKAEEIRDLWLKGAGIVMTRIKEKATYESAVHGPKN